MKALSIQQPWAWLIAAGHKDVENRTWSTDHRGPFLIHAGRTFDDGGYAWVQTHFDLALPDPAEFPRGGLVGAAEIADCVTEHPSRWFSGPYGFVIARPREVPFTPRRGQLRFFEAGDLPS